MRLLEISRTYLNREAQKGNSVEQWIENYCQRNKIPVMSHHKDWGLFGEMDTYLQLHFKSSWQMDCFARAGNREYPYFEFL